MTHEAGDEPRCAECGRLRADDPPMEMLTWVAERSDRRTTWMCPRCARRHVRDIEAKVPSEYW